MPKRDYDFSTHSLLNRAMGETVDEFIDRSLIIISQLRAKIAFEERLLGYGRAKRVRVTEDYIVVPFGPTYIASSSNPPTGRVEPPVARVIPPAEPNAEPENVENVEENAEGEGGEEGVGGQEQGGGDEGGGEEEGQEDGEEEGEEEEEEEEVEESVGAPFPILPPHLEIQATEYLSENEDHNETIYEFKVCEYYKLFDESDDDADEIEDNPKQPIEDEDEFDIPFLEDVQDWSDLEEDMEFDIGDPWAKEEDPVEFELNSDDESAIDYPEDVQSDETSDSETEIVEISSDETDDDSDSDFDP